MSYILLQIENKPVQRLTLFDQFIFRDSRIPKIYLEYGYTHPGTTFHVYIYNFFHYRLKRIFIEKIFLCDQFNAETNIWTGKVNLDLNDLISSFDTTRIFLKFNFNTPKPNRILSLQVLSTCAIGNTLQNNQDIQQLPLPPLLKTHFEKNYLESPNSLKSWFFCETVEKKPLYYFGSPGTLKRLDIHEFTRGKFVCTWKNLDTIVPYDNYVILRITLVNAYYRVQNMDSIVARIKKRNFRDLQQCFLNKSVNHTINTQLIIISDYAPEIFFETCEEKEWILDNLFVVKKKDSPKKWIDLRCSICNEYTGKIKWFDYKPYHKKCLYDEFFRKLLMKIGCREN